MQLTNLDANYVRIAEEISLSLAVIKGKLNANFIE